MNVLIVDDEKPNREGVKLLLTEHCPEINIVGDADSTANARIILQNNQVDVILLDINMPNENGFALIDFIKNKNILIVFITAYAEYAIRAFKANAIDYLLKPIDEQDLIASIDKCKQRLKQLNIESNAKEVYSLSVLNAGQDVLNKTFPVKLTLPHMHGFQIIAVENIVYLEAEGNYTTVFLANAEKLLVSKGMKEFENLLDPTAFFRAHKSTLINLNYVKEYSSIDGQTAVMQNGAKVIISRRRLDEFMAVINLFSKRI